ncbi:MAG: helicase-related protein [Daejeonella sp.]
MAFNKKEVFEKNLTAINTALNILKEKEKGKSLSTISKNFEFNPQNNQTLNEIFNEYKGFGGIKEVLLSDDKADWTKSSLPLYELRQELEKACTDLDLMYRVKPGTFYSSIKNSVLSSFFTPSVITESISKPLIESFNPKRILEPSAGMGVFVDGVIADFDSDNLREICAVEKDTLTALLLKTKYELSGLTSSVGINTVNVISGAFEDLADQRIGSRHLYGQTFDLSISNIPFGDIKVFDEKYNKSKIPLERLATNRIHNYFFVKNLDMVADKGIIAFITTSSFLNTPGNQNIRKYILSKSDVISITRLPNKLFADHAGTEVSSDLIILQKNSAKTNLSEFDNKLSNSSLLPEYGNLNEAFDSYTNKSLFIADQIRFDTDMYGKPAAILDYHGSIAQLAEALKVKISYDILEFKAAKKDIYINLFESPQNFSVIEKIKPNSPALNNTLQFNLFDAINEEESSIKSYSGEIFPWYENGTLVINNGQVGILSKVEADLNEVEEISSFNFSVLNQNQYRELNLKQVSAYISIRDSFNQLYSEEKNLLVEKKELRGILNDHYNNYFKEYGSLNDRKSKALINFDSHAAQSFAFEKRTIDANKQFVFTKADLFNKPIAFSTDEFRIKSPVDALFLSVNTFNAIDLTFISKHTGISDQAELLKSIDDYIYYDFEKDQYQYRDSFLIGNIVQKIKYYERNFPASDLKDKSSEEGKSYQALKKVLPARIGFQELDFNLGERWLPVEHYQKFASQLFETKVNIYYTRSLDSFHVEAYSTNSMIDDVYSVKTEGNTYNGFKLLEHGLVNTTPYVTKTAGTDASGNPIKVPDHEAMRSISIKIEEISAKFQDYINQIPESEKKEIEDLYNNSFNCYSTYKPSGAHISFPGLTHFKLLEHQSDATWKLVLNGGGICDHPVGAGKSLVMACEAQKLKEIGFAKKPMITCLKANAEDVAKDYMKAFPDAKILFPGDGDFSREKRVSFLNMIKNNDWDCVILTHEQFSMIPQVAEIQNDLLARELKQLEEDVEDLKIRGTKISKGMIKGLEKRKVSLAIKLKSVLADIKKDEGVPNFRDLGIDHLAVDESHEFKNLAFTTRHDRVAGLGNTLGSNRSFNMLIACRTLQAHHQSDKGITFYSGTTISNSLTELYNIFKYLTPSELKKQKIYNFDSWASVFTKKSTEYEVSVTNQLIMKERFRTFIKVPELCALYNKVSHFVSQRDLKVKRPGNEVKLVNIPLTIEQEGFTQRLINFANTGDGELIHRPKLTDSELTAKMLIATNTAKKMALDLRLVDRSYSDDDGNKLSVCAKNINDFYHKTSIHKGTQLVFSDLGTPNSDGRFDVYSELKRKLVEDYKIPSSEIAFIHEAKTNSARAALFAKVNKGEVRVFMGSTKKMGTGVNVQKKVVAMHDLDIPWTPKDLEQRHGRGSRQGNEVAPLYDNTVKTFVYAVNKSLDAYKFNLLTNKQLFIDQVKNNTLSQRKIDEGAMDEHSGLPFKEYVAILSGNTDLIDKLKLEKAIAGLEAEKKSFSLSQAIIENKLSDLTKKLPQNEKIFKDLQSDLKVYTDNLKYDPKTEAKLNPIKINNKSFENPEEAGTEILKIYNSKIFNVPTKIGELYGFDLIIRPANHDVLNVLIAKRSSIEYTYSNGIPNENPNLAARYFLNAIDKVKDLEKSYKGLLGQMYKDIQLLQSQVGRTWEKSGHLNKLKVEASMLENKIISSISKSNSETGNVLKDVKDEKLKPKEMVSLKFNKLELKGPAIR